MSHVQVWLRMALPTLVVVALVCANAPRASAGTYDVYACDGAHGGGASPSWATAADGGFAVYTACPAPGEGIVARSSWDNGYSSWLQGGYQIFDAPPGATVDSLHGYIRLQRPSCDWGVGVVGGNQDLTGTTLYYLPSGYCGVDQFDWLWRDLAVNAPRVRIEARCGVASCLRGQAYSGGPGVAEVQLRDAHVTVRDDTAPSLTNGGGSLLTSSGWVSGMQSVSFDASDNTGIQLAGVDIDDRRVNGDTKACDYTQRVPCPNGGFAGVVDTSTIRPDGPHTLTLEAIDTAGNRGTSSRTILVDNTAPIAVRDLAVDGGEGWRNTNQFSVRWQNPAPDSGAPIAGAGYQLCRASGASCITASRRGDKLTAITDLKVPSAGDWTLQLWPRDAAGNEDVRNTPPSVHLRFDDGAPDVAFAPLDPNDPTLVTAAASDAVSGVAEAQIELRRQGSDTWQALSTSYDGHNMTARIDDQALAQGTYELRAHAVDAAGNERTTQTLADGQPATVALPLRLGTRFRQAGLRHGRLGTASMAHRLRVRYGHAVRIRGRLATAQGNPLPEVDVLVYSRARRQGAPTRLVATLKTSRHGGFTYRAPKGVSRTIEFRYGGTPTIQAAAHAVQLLVRAGSTMHASRRLVLNGETVRFHGRLRGRSIPAGGKLVEIQVILRGHWHTFGTIHTGQRGRWHYDYRFDGTHGRQTYHFRVRIPREGDHPFETGHSRAIRVKVRGL